MRLTGIFPPIATPFDERGELDLAAMRFNVAKWMKTPIAGILVLGSNGEAPFVDDDEAERLIAAAREGVPRDRVLLAGTGRQSTRATIAATKRAAKQGADGVLVLTPGYFKGQTNHDAFVRHYQAVADESPVPVYIYNFTNVSGVNILPATTAKLAGHPNIAGIKESNGDVGQVGEVVSVVPSDFSVVVGSAPTLYASLCVGARGGIVAAACVIPELIVRLYELTISGRHEEAIALQRQVTPFSRAVTTQHGVPGLKAALTLAGYRCGPPRSPLAPLPAAGVESIRAEYEKLFVRQT